MAEKSPAFQFYPKDYLTDAKVVAMTPEIRGLYVQLLCHDWLEDGIYPGDICALSGFEWFREDGALRDDWNTIEQVLNRCFIQHPTDPQKVTNPRLLRARQEQLENREKKRLAGIESGKARKSKELSLGTDVRLCSSKKGTQSNSSSSSSSSSSNINTPLPPKGFENQEANKSLSLWIEYRGQIGKKLRPATIQQLIKKYSGIPNEFITCVSHSIEQGYQGLFMPKENGTASGNFKTREQLERDDFDAIMARGLEKAKAQGLK